MSTPIQNRLGITFDAMQEASVEYREPPSKPWNLKDTGNSLDRGNYKLYYSTAFDGRPVDFRSLREKCRLYLQVINSGYRVDVTHVRNGGSIGRQTLLDFLDKIDSLSKSGDSKWGKTIRCTLVLGGAAGEKESNGVGVKTPVQPWVGSLDPDRLVADKTIKYCLADETVGYSGEDEIYYGQILMHIQGDPNLDRLYFTLKGALQTEPKWRGFACIGLVGNVYRAEPLYDTGDNVRAKINGEPPVDMDRDSLLVFLNTKEGRSGWYMIWKKGHAGLIRDGVLYECKPPGRGFTVESYNEDEQSAVRYYTHTELESNQGLKRGKDTIYHVSKIKPPPWAS